MKKEMKIEIDVHKSKNKRKLSASKYFVLFGINSKRTRLNSFGIIIYLVNKVLIFRKTAGIIPYNRIFLLCYLKSHVNYFF